MTTNTPAVRRGTFWAVTGIVAAAALSGGIGQLMHATTTMEGLAALGYPPHFATILGFWKIAGALALLVPGVPTLKEWAYAGLFFDFTGASFAHFSAGNGTMLHAGAPLILAAALLISWWLRSGERRTPIRISQRSRAEALVTA